MCIRPAQETEHKQKKSFDKAADMRSADVKGWKRGKDNVVLIGEIAVILLALLVSCDGHCQQGAC